MPMTNENGLTCNVVITAEQATKVNDTDGRFPENRQTGSFPDAGSGIEKVEQEEGETAVALDESGSNLVAELSPRPSSARVPFANLNQIDADLALAHTLQEQERAYMMLNRNRGISNYWSWATGSYVYDEDEFDDSDTDDEDEDEDDEYEDEIDDDPQEDASAIHANNNNVEEIAYSDDEAYARALQEAEYRDMAASLSALSGIRNQIENLEDQRRISQDALGEVDPDELSYEELLALGEIMGTESRGLSADAIAALPSKMYKEGDDQNGTNESCVICCLDYEDDDDLILLPCSHTYHSECINNWLKINKVCPVCSAEVSTSTSGENQ